MSVGSRSLISVFSLNKQADVLTRLLAANVDKRRSTIGYVPWVRRRDVSVHDQSWYGKSNFATFNETLHQSYALASQNKAASDLDLLFASAFVMGNKTTDQPDALGKPTQWRHIIKFADIGASPTPDYTTFTEQQGGGTTPGYKFDFVGAWLSQFQISGTFGDFVQLNFEGGARELVDPSTVTIPAGITAASLFNINRCTMTLDDVGGGPTNIDGEWVGFDLTFNQNPDIKYRSGQPTGEEELIERADRGDQTVTGNIRIEFADTKRDRFLTDTHAAISIGLISKDEIEGDPVSCTIDIPEVVIESESWSEEGRTAILQLDIAEQSILSVGGADPITLTFITGIDNTELLVNGSV